MDTPCLADLLNYVYRSVLGCRLSMSDDGMPRADIHNFYIALFDLLRVYELIKCMRFECT